MTITIDTGVAAPGEWRGKGIYPFRKLEPGDSFFVAGKKTAQMGGALHHARKVMPERTFAGRTVVENGVKGVRVWRVK